VPHSNVGSMRGSRSISGIRMISLIHSLMYTKLLHGFSHVLTMCSRRFSEVHPGFPFNLSCRHSVVLPNRSGIGPSRTIRSSLLGLFRCARSLESVHSRVASSRLLVRIPVTECHEWRPSLFHRPLPTDRSLHSRASG
jgi:hypothetical protein